MGIRLISGEGLDAAIGIRPLLKRGVSDSRNTIGIQLLE